MSASTRNQNYQEKFRFLIANININHPIEIKQYIHIKNLTIFIGENGSGKTTLLEKIFVTKFTKGNTIRIRAGYYLTDNRDPEEENDTNETENDAVTIDEPIDYIIYTNPSAVFTDTDSIKYLKSKITLSSFYDAISEVIYVLNEIHNELKANLHDEEFMPITSALKLIDDPDRLSDYTSFIITLTLYSYSLSRNGKNVLLLIDEPESFSYPSVVYTTGRIFRHLTMKSPNLFIITTTHSWDLFAGAYRGGADWLEVYNFKKLSGKKVLIERLNDDLYIPGFSMPALLR